MYPRQHLTLLLQISTTNAVESWHNALKKKSTAITRTQVQYSLMGLCRMIHEVGLQFDARSERRAAQFRTKNLSECIIYPGLKYFPFPFQKLIVGELRIAQQYVEDAVPLRRYTEVRSCRCNFYVKYYLPCCYIWQRYIMYDALKDDDFKEFAFKFEDHGYDIYEVFNKDYVERDEPATNLHQQSREVADSLRARELFENLRTKWFNLMEESAPLAEEDRIALRANWVNGLSRAIGPFLRATARAILSNDYFDGVLRDLQDDGQLREEDDQLDAPAGSLAPPKSTFEGLDWAIDRGLGAFDYEEGEAPDDVEVDAGSGAGSDVRSIASSDSDSIVGSDAGAGADAEDDEDAAVFEQKMSDELTAWLERDINTRN
jgi:hypothetical protein